MTAKIVFKIGKYLENASYKKGMISILEGVGDDCKTVDAVFLFYDHLGMSMDNLTKEEFIKYVEDVCSKVDLMPDEAKADILQDWLKSYN